MLSKLVIEFHVHFFRSIRPGGSKGCTWSSDGRSKWLIHFLFFGRVLKQYGNKASSVPAQQRIPGPPGPNGPQGPNVSTRAFCNLPTVIAFVIIIIILRYAGCRWGKRSTRTSRHSGMYRHSRAPCLALSAPKKKKIPPIERNLLYFKIVGRSR